MHYFFVTLNYLSVLIILVCTLFIASQKESRMQKLALMECLMTLFCSIGYLWKDEAQTVEGILAGYKLCYGTVTHAMFLMLLFIMAYCDFRIPRSLTALGHGINILVSAVVLTMDYHPLFYKSCWLEPGADGFFHLEKDYGVFHTLVVGLFAAYMALAVVITIVYSVRNLKKRGAYVRRLLLAVAIPCVCYIVPKLLDIDNDLQPIAFALFMSIVVRMVYRYRLYDVDNILMEYSIVSTKDAVVVIDGRYRFKGCNERAREIFPFLADLSLDTDIRRESEVLTDLFSGNVREYSHSDQIYAVSLRHVDRGGKRSGMVLWMDDVTLERNYSNLLRREKRYLESEVMTLSDISYKDQMTGLFNRRSYEEKIKEIRSSGDTSHIAVFAMDVDGLKGTNDNMGHAAGDELITGAAEVIKSVFDDAWTVYRTGGDEFFAVCEADAGAGDQAAELEKACRAWHGKLVRSLSISCGCCRGAEHPGMTIDAIMVEADRKMYENKQAHYARKGEEA